MKKLWMLVAVLAVTGIASAELLEDGGFESGAMAWNDGLNLSAWDLKFADVGGGGFSGTGWYYAAFQAIVEPWEARSGDKYLRMGTFTPSWNWASWGWAELGQIVTAAEGAAPGVEYTLTANFMDDRGFWGDTGTVDVHIKMNFKSSTGGNLPNGQNEQAAQISSDWNDGWQPVTLTATAPAGTAEIRCLVGTSYAAWIDPDPSFVRVDDVSLCTSEPVAVSPDPAVGATVASTCQTELSWETCAAGTFDVYLVEGDPNGFDPNDLVLIASDVTTDTVAVTLDNNTDYVWRVDGAADGTLWSFSTGDAVPEVDAGSAQYLVLDPTVTASLGALVCDDGNSSVSYLWTVNPAGPVIASETSLVTTATISAPGSYTFTLTATDAAGDGTATVTVNVYDDACAAAIADPADYTAPFEGDVSGPFGDPDCLVDLYDFAAMATDWLDCASSKLGCTP